MGQRVFQPRAKNARGSCPVALASPGTLLVGGTTHLPLSRSQSLGRCALGGEQAKLPEPSHPNLRGTLPALQEHAPCSAGAGAGLQYLTVHLSGSLPILAG